jgi:hypothetical protein
MGVLAPVSRRGAGGALHVPAARRPRRPVDNVCGALGRATAALRSA